MNPDPKIPYITWRNGRPRFMPSKGLRDRGHIGQDLKLEDGTWMTAGQCLEWSMAFRQQLELEKRSRKPAPKKKQTAPALKPLTRIYPVQQLLHDWLNATLNPDIADLRPKTVQEYRYKAAALAKYAPDIYAAEVEALDNEICRGLYDTLRVKAGLPTAVGTLRILGIAIHWGRSRGRLRGLNSNPAHGLDMKTPTPRLRVASIAEIDHLVMTADAMGHHEIGDMIVFAVWSGQRQADRLEYTRQPDKDGRMRFLQAKTGARVSLKHAPELQARLEAATIRRKEKEIVSDLVVINERAKKPFQKSYYSHLLLDIRRCAAERAPASSSHPKIEPMPSLLTLTDQDFRDTAVTWLARAGATIPEICSVTGHSFKTADTILNHYLALDEEMADSAIDKMTIWHAKERA